MHKNYDNDDDDQCLVYSIVRAVSGSASCDWLNASVILLTVIKSLISDLIFLRISSIVLYFQTACSSRPPSDVIVRRLVSSAVKVMKSQAGDYRNAD